jgi:hypothetical protein
MDGWVIDAIEYDNDVSEWLLFRLAILTIISD